MTRLSILGRRASAAVAAAVLVLAVSTGDTRAAPRTFSENEILAAAENFFGVASKGLAEVVQKIFKDLGEPNAFIAGEEISGAFFVGLRYGRGEVNLKGRAPAPIYWQGPSIGFDFGGNASKTFTLVYGLSTPDSVYGRYPGVDGSIYVVAGVGVNYQTDGTVTLAPIRTGVGLRFGGNLGYLHYSPDASLIPF